MSSHSQTVAPPSNFKPMLDASLAEYKKKTGNDLLAHYLASELQTCESVDAVLDILRDQAMAFEKSGDQKMMKWIDPLVHVLYTFSGALSDGASVAFPPAKVIFTGIGVLLAAAKDIRASHGAIVDLFERIESFFKRLEVYTQISLTARMAEVLVKIVIELLSILSIATKEVKRPLAKIFSRKLLGRTDIEDALKRLDSLIQDEIQMAIAQNLKVTTEVKEGADNNGVTMQQLSSDMEGVKRDMEEVKWAQISQNIHKWFSPPDPSTNYNIACEAHHEGTAAWFFQDEQFKDWMSIGSLLWVHGKPGSGKSILCSAIIKHVMSLRDAGLASLAYFYFDFRDKGKKQDFRNFVTSLLVQLSAHSSPCCEIISRIYSAHEKGTQQPSNGALTNCLREMLLVASKQPIYIIIDALDECPDFSGMPTPREVVLDFLMEIVRLSLTNLHICVTSRPEIDIKKVLGRLPHRAVSLHDENGQKKDISDYVSSVVYADRKMQSWRNEEKKLVVEELSEKADGMFRWVFCQLEVLRHCFPANIRQTLNELPETLDETYARVLRHINKGNQAHAHRMLQCLMVAVRPLRVEELAELLAFEFDAAQGEVPKYRPAWRLDDQTQAVLSICSSLVTIIDETWYGSQCQVVQFSHFSVKEFLMSDRLISPLGDFSRYQILPASAHTILTQACLGFLLYLDDHNDKRDSKGFPLAEYAARHWVEHAQFEDVASHVEDGIETLFDSDKQHFAAWIGIYDIDTPTIDPWDDWDLDISFNPSSHPNSNPLYYSVLCGFYNLVKHLAAKHPQDVNAVCGRYSFPLLAALSEGHIEVAELLLEHGANADAQETTGNTILLKALLMSQDNLASIVKFLLEHGANVNVQDDITLRSSLHLAEYEGNLEVAQMLVEYKADVKSPDNHGQTPLHILSERPMINQDDVFNHVRLLLKHGAEVNRRDKGNRTPLLMAMRRNRFELARILLEHGTDVNAENNDKALLQMLSECRPWTYDDKEVLDRVGLLLEHGAEVNRRDKDNQTLLHLALGWDWFQLARFLLERGADANAENNNGETSLHLMLRSWNLSGDGPDLMWLLLEHGAVVNVRDRNNQTPLLLAMERNRFKLAQILLANGADANSENRNGKTPLHLLLERQVYIYDTSTVDNMLDHRRSYLEHDAEVNRQYKGSGTPLLLEMDASLENNIGDNSVHQVSRGQCSTQERGVGVAQLPLDMDVQDKDHTTPSHLQTRFGSVQIAQTLNPDGANFNAEDDEGETSLYQELKGEHGQDDNHLSPLNSRSFYERLDIKRASLNHGATSKSEDCSGKTPSRAPLYLTAEHSYSFGKNRIRTAQLLIEYGAGVNAQDRNNRTPLHLASYCGNVEIARVLLGSDATTNSQDNRGRTPLHVVAEGFSRDNDVLVTQLLLEHGADVDVTDDNNQTPLHLASYFGRVELVLALLNAGANSNAKDAQGQTPLHLVSQHSRYSQDYGVAVARLLLDHGADVNSQDKSHATPSDSASYYQRTEIADLLTHYGSKANAKIDQRTIPRRLELEGV